MEHTEENWVGCPGFEKYYSVSNHGRIRRDAPTRNGKKAEVPRHGHPSPNGYLVVRLNGNPGVQTWHTVHSLVALAFIGDRPLGYEINHKNGVKTNNLASNLEYVTCKGNHEHASKLKLKASGYRHGSRIHPETRPRGESNKRSTFIESEILQIRKQYEAGISICRIARERGRATTVISRIVKRKSWAHVY